MPLASARRTSTLSRGGLAVFSCTQKVVSSVNDRDSFASFLDLPFKTYLLPFVAIGGLLGEGSLTGWFLAKGVNVQRWKEQAAVTE